MTIKLMTFTTNNCTDLSTSSRDTTFFHSTQCNAIPPFNIFLNPYITIRLYIQGMECAEFDMGVLRRDASGNLQRCALILRRVCTL